MRLDVIAPGAQTRIARGSRYQLLTEVHGCIVAQPFVGDAHLFALAIGQQRQVDRAGQAAATELHRCAHVDQWHAARHQFTGGVGGDHAAALRCAQGTSSRTGLPASNISRCVRSSSSTSSSPRFSALAMASR